jgi:uncharacterized protein
MNRMPKRILAPTLLAILFAALTALAGDVPFLSGRVNDETGMLSGETVQKLNTLLKAHEDSTSNQVVVLIVSSLDGQEIEEYSMKVVEAWKLGQKGKDNGVLLLVSRDDRRVRIEVGRGLEGPLPDITCAHIIRNEIVPKFKAGDYEGGVTGGVDAILGSIAGSYTADTSGESAESNQLPDLAGVLIGSLMFFFVVGTFTVILIMSPKGSGMWFLYLFLIPFWAAFPMALYGLTIGGIMLICYLVGVPLARTFVRSTDRGKRWVTSFAASSTSSGGSSSSGSSWSSSSSSSSSFSGGGGSFSGGGSSGSW